jgi:hypothetical protein
MDHPSPPLPDPFARLAECLSAMAGPAKAVNSDSEDPAEQPKPFRKKRRRSGFRPRMEFAALEAQLDPKYFEKSWRQFVNFVLHGELSIRSYADQFRLHERIRRLHARRTRYNVKRKAKRVGALTQYARREYGIFIQLGFLGDLQKGDRWIDLLAGGLLTDRRLAIKFFARMEAVRESVFPAVPPWVIDPARAEQEAAAQPIKDPARAGFEGSLLPVDAAGPPENVSPFARPQEPAQDDAQNPPAQAATAAS